MATQAIIQLNVRLRWAKSAMTKKARIGTPGINQVIVFSICSFIGSTQLITI
jgi:hypothetical protein